MFKFFEKNFIKIILIILILKLFLLPFSSHPFDFRAFANHLQRHFLYGWNLFEYWNKGNLLLFIWYPFYYVYSLIISYLNISGDNLYLLHFTLKLPFIIVDLLSGFLIYKIVFRLYNSLKYAKIAFFIWFINPIVFYIYGIHGHYELLTIFGIILLIYGLIDKRLILIALGFVISFTTKYFTIIFMPFVFLYIFKNLGLKKTLTFTFYILLFLALSFIHLILDKELFFQTIGSILTLSAPNSPEGVSIVNLPPINIFSAFNYLFGNISEPINNFNHPFVFNLSSKGLLISALLLVGMFFYELYLVFVKKIQYSFEIVFDSILTSFIIFLLFLGNFQPHYIGWLVPLLIILSFKNRIFFNILLILSLVGFIYSFRSEYGIRTFFMDIYDTNINILGLNLKLYENVYLEGAIIMFLLPAIFLTLFIKKAKEIKFNLLYFSLLILPWIFIILAFSSIFTFKTGVTYDKLSYARYLNYNKGSIFGGHKIEKIEGNKYYFENTSGRGGALIFQTISTLNQEDKEKFRAYILFSNGYFEGKINNCKLGSTPEIVFNQINRTYYNGIQVNIDCLKSSGNYLEVDKVNAGFNSDGLILYVFNTGY